MHPAYSVIFFTTASGAGYGLIALLALFGVLNGVPLDPWLGAIGFGLGTVLITGGLLSSTAHLGHPERAWRAYSQWKSSWLSREGILATATYVPLALTAWGWIVEGSLTGTFGMFAVALALLCLLTVYATGMIYATLRTISAWHNRRTVPVYLSFALLTGSMWLHALTQMFGYQTPMQAAIVAVGLLLVLFLKRSYWRIIDTTPGAATPESATGLGDIGKVRLLDNPTMTETFIQREMGYSIARKHSQKLRRIAFLFYCVIPFALTLLTSESEPWIAIPGTLAAALCVSFGAVVERWLFFAEAKHVSMLYYGAESA
jgi:sulfite dehydrogenase (quinone) subunit SoeC